MYDLALDISQLNSILSVRFERVPVVHIDSLSQLSSILFSAERQVLYAGIDPTPAYVQWLRFIGDQFGYRKHVDPSSLTVFEGNEFLDLRTVVVYYGRLQHKKLEKNLKLFVKWAVITREVLMLLWI